MKEVVSKRRWALGIAMFPVWGLLLLISWLGEQSYSLLERLSDWAEDVAPNRWEK